MLRAAVLLAAVWSLPAHPVLQGRTDSFFFLFLSSPKDMLIDFRERGRYREGERNMDVREKH